MSSYSGLAVVVAGNMEYACRVSLRSSHESVPDDLTPDGPRAELAWWVGDVETDDDAATWVIMQADDPQLRIGERQAGFVPEGPGTHGLQIRGNGEPPFGP